MKILYLKGYKWLVPQNQQVRTDFFGYRQSQAPDNQVKPFLKNIKVKQRQWHRMYIFFGKIKEFCNISSISNISFGGKPSIFNKTSINAI